MVSELQILVETNAFEKVLTNEPTLNFGLGGLIYQLYFNTNCCEGDLSTWYDGFLVKNSDENAIRIGYLTEDDLDPLDYARFLENSTLYRNVKVIADDPLLSEEEVAVFRWDFRALVNKKTRTCRVFLLQKVAGSIDAIARIAGALLYVEKNAFLVHGSSIVHNGKGYLFTGTSGSGKSTIAELSGARVLNDEISLIQVDEEGDVFVHGTPFYGDLKQGENARAPLHGMYLLTQSESIFIQKIDELKQHLSLLRNVIFFQTDIDSFDRISAIVARTLQHTPLEMLHFDKNNLFMEVLP